MAWAGESRSDPRPATLGQVARKEWTLTSAGDNRNSDGNADDELREFSSPPCYRQELDPGYAAAVGPVATDWSAVRTWRHEQRQRIRAFRGGIAQEVRANADRAIAGFIGNERILDAGDTGIYWPLPGEFDSRPLMARVLEAGGRVGIPVVVAPGAGLEFWAWDPDTVMQPRGPWNLLAPSERRVIEPAIVFVPLVGFDGTGHRLGNGGGYFDRTLADPASRPVTIGVGYEFGRLDTIYPQAHDVPLDAIVTERAFRWHGPRYTARR